MTLHLKNNPAAQTGKQTGSQENESPTLEIPDQPKPGGPGEKYQGCLSKETAEALLKEIEEDREAWG